MKKGSYFCLTSFCRGDNIKRESEVCFIFTRQTAYLCLCPQRKNKNKQKSKKGELHADSNRAHKQGVKNSKNICR